MSRWGKRDDMVVHKSDPYNAEPPRAALAASTRTPVDTFYTRNHGPIPDLDADRWRLRVDGLVERELELSLAALQQLPHATVEATMQCAGNRRAGLVAVRDIPGEDPWGASATSTAEWVGVRLNAVLRAAGVEEAAQHVELHIEFAAPDVSELADPPQPYGASIPLAKALRDEVLLAWQMNGAPLLPVHGAPVRVVVPGWIGARSVKWVERITVRDTPSDNWFQAVAYRLLPPDADPSTAGPGSGLSLTSVALNCDVLSPPDGATVPSGDLDVTGYAYAGDDRRVARVDVSTDDGSTWLQADLDPPVSAWTWQHWRASVRVDGPTTILARAWDSTGALQPESPAQLWNPKGYVNNSWARITVTTSA